MSFNHQAEAERGLVSFAYRNQQDWSACMVLRVGASGIVTFWELNPGADRIAWRTTDGGWSGSPVKSTLHWVAPMEDGDIGAARRWVRSHLAELKLAEEHAARDRSSGRNRFVSFTREADDV